MDRLWISSALATLSFTVLHDCILGASTPSHIFRGFLNYTCFLEFILLGDRINRRGVYTLTSWDPVGVVLRAVYGMAYGGVYLRTCITIITMKFFIHPMRFTKSKGVVLYKDYTDSIQSG